MFTGGDMTKDEALELAIKQFYAFDFVMKRSESTEKAIAAIKQALAAPVQPVAWAEYHYKKGMFTGLTTNDINAVDSVGDGCQWVPQLQATTPAQPAPVPLTDEQKVLRSLLGAALGALRYHTEQTRPIQRTNETITAIEHELAAHGITKGQP